MQRTDQEWDHHFLGLAYQVGQMSKDPSTKIGVVLVRDKKVISCGYNGFPKGIADDERLHDRAQKYPRTVHAEMNAIIQAGRDAEGCTMYLYGMPGPPCGPCAKHIIAAGISRVVTRDGEIPERWAEDFALARDMLSEAEIPVRYELWTSPLEQLTASTQSKRSEH